MHFSGEQVISASREVVWRAMNDPQVLQKCLPGCELVKRSAEDRFDVVIAAVVGPLKARFSGSLQIRDANPPQSCTMVFEGQGGAVGFGKGSSTVTLTPNGMATTVNYSAQAQVGGKLAQVGSRLIDGVARKMSDDFFNALRQQVNAAVPSRPLELSEASQPVGARAVGRTRFLVVVAAVTCSVAAGVILLWN